MGSNPGSTLYNLGKLLKLAESPFPVKINKRSPWTVESFQQPKATPRNPPWLKVIHEERDRRGKQFQMKTTCFLNSLQM